MENKLIFKCSNCKIDKPITEFYKKSSKSTSPNSHYYNCKSCHRKSVNQYKKKSNYMRRYMKTNSYRYLMYIRGAKARNIEFKIDFKTFKQFKGLDCNYCGVKLQRVGIDRLDNTKGYIEGNCVPCCSICNKMKGNLELQDFQNHIEKIFKYWQSIQEKPKLSLTLY